MDKLKDKINYSRIKSLKKKFWKEHTLLFNEYPEAMELMRAIGVEQGKVQLYKEALEIEKELLEEIGEKFYYQSDIEGVSLKLNELEEYKEFKALKIAEDKK